MSEGWIGVDLDGTLAEYLGWQGMGHIGEPIAPMVERVKAWLAVGKDVRIFTARVCSGQSQEEIDVFLREYTRWCFQVFGRQLPVTCEKDWKMIKLWDDRCVSVIPNTGEIIPLDSNERVKELEKENREQLIDYENRLCEAKKYQQDAVRRCEELEAERDRLREALEEIAKFANSEYGKRIPAPSCVEFSTIKRYAEKALEGTENE